MERFITIALALAIMLGLTNCGKKSEKTDTAKESVIEKLENKFSKPESPGAKKQCKKTPNSKITLDSDY